MALTLVEAAKLSNDVLLEGVVEEIIYDSPILQSLPFIEIVGDGLRYNRELTLGSIDFYDVGDTWTESTPTFTPVTANLVIMGGDADVDEFLKRTRSNIQDLEAAVIQQKAKALRHKWEQTFIYGNQTTSPKEFDGLRKIIDTFTLAGITGRQVVQMGTAGGGVALSFLKLDELIDKVKGGKPSALIMSKRSRRIIQSKTRAAGWNLEQDKTALGTFITRYNGIPLWETDWILDTHVTTGSGAGQYESATTTGDESVIFAVRLGEGALSGLTSPGHIQVQPIGSLETKDATRVRIKFYPGLAVFSTLSVAALIGVDAT